MKYSILHMEKQLGASRSGIYPVLIDTENEVLLFDAGFPGQLEDFEKELASVGYTFNEVTKLVVSHQDHDHMGSLKAIKERYRHIEIIASASETPYIDGTKPSLRLVQADSFNQTLSGPSKAFGEKFSAYLRTIEPCPIDTQLDKPGYIAEGIQVIFTPGHTPGHVSLYLQEIGLFLAGDALAIEDGHFVIANPQFTLDMEQTLASIKKIQGMNPSQIICYHGGKIDTEVGQKLNELVRKCEESGTLAGIVELN